MYPGYLSTRTYLQTPWCFIQPTYPSWRTEYPDETRCLHQEDQAYPRHSDGDTPTSQQGRRHIELARRPTRKQWPTQYGHSCGLLSTSPDLQQRPRQPGHQQEQRPRSASWKCPRQASGHGVEQYKHGSSSPTGKTRWRYFTSDCCASQPCKRSWMQDSPHGNGTQ